MTDCRAVGALYEHPRAVTEGVNELESSDIPLLHEEGWMRLKKFREASLAPQTGWSSMTKRFGRLDHPGRSTKDASRHLLMSRPPLLGEEGTVARNVVTVEQQTRQAVDCYVNALHEDAAALRSVGGECIEFLSFFRVIRFNTFTIQSFG